MPLKLDFKAGDKMVINGTVIENVGTNAKLVIHNESAILREKEVLTAEDAVTPATRIYFSLQCAYVFPDKMEEHLDQFREFLDDFVGACPSIKSMADEIAEHVAEDRLYKGLKMTHKLISHEAEVFDRLQQEIGEYSNALEPQEAAAASKTPEPEPGTETEAEPTG